jgi:cell division septal protein FtsQ
MARQPLDLRKGKKESVPEPVRQSSRTSYREPKRATPLRVRKRRKRYVLALAVCAIAVAGAFGIQQVSYLPRYTIQTITVSGTVALSPDDIRGRVESFFAGQRSFIAPKSIFRFHGAALEQYLKTDILHIAQATVVHPGLFSDELDVQIEERVPFARWCSPDRQCFFIDQTGFIFSAETPGVQSPEPLIFYGGVSDPENPLGHYVAVARFPSALALSRALGQAGFAPADLSIDSDTDLTVHLQDSFAVRASFGADANALVRDLRLILGSDPLKDHLADIEYVDLRFGNRVFYKLKGQEAVGE